MKNVIVVLVGLAVSASLGAHPGDEDETWCDYSMLDGEWEVFYPEGDASEPGLDERALLTISHYDAAEDGTQLFEVTLDGDDHWTIGDGVKGKEVECSQTEGLLIEIPIQSQSIAAKLCVQRVGNLIDLMSRKDEPPKLKQVGIYREDRELSCKIGISGVRTPGHAHADD